MGCNRTLTATVSKKWQKQFPLWFELHLFKASIKVSEGMMQQCSRDGRWKADDPKVTAL